MFTEKCKFLLTIKFFTKKIKFSNKSNFPFKFIFSKNLKFSLKIQNFIKNLFIYNYNAITNYILIPQNELSNEDLHSFLVKQTRDSSGNQTHDPLADRPAHS